MTNSADRARLRRTQRLEKVRNLGSSDPKVVEAAKGLVEKWWPNLEGEGQAYAIKETIEHFEDALTRAEKDPNWLKAYKRRDGTPYTEGQFARMMISSWLKGMGYLTDAPHL